MKQFLGFVFISGVGWLLDMTSYAAFSQFFGMKPSCANFISSMAGVTYVWIMSLNRLFNRREFGKSIFLPIYWCYQTVSILAYSGLISIAVAAEVTLKVSSFFAIHSDLVAKIIITFPNLITNFIFMKILTGFMKPATQQRRLL